MGKFQIETLAHATEKADLQNHSACLEKRLSHFSDKISPCPNSPEKSCPESCCLPDVSPVGQALRVSVQMYSSWGRFILTSHLDLRSSRSCRNRVWGRACSAWLSGTRQEGRGTSPPFREAGGRPGTGSPSVSVPPSASSEAGPTEGFFPGSEDVRCDVIGKKHLGKSCLAKPT